MQEDGNGGSSPYMTLAAFCTRHPWAREGGLRRALRHRADNGLATCVVYLGRRLLLDEQAVLAWVKARGAVRGSLAGPGNAQATGVAA